MAQDKINVKLESTVKNQKVESRLLIELPEYEKPIIVLEKHLAELKKSINLLTDKK